MKENNLPDKKKTFSLDWLIGGILTKIGDTFDRLTGRGYKPSSSLATSELIERLKLLLDAEIKESEGNAKYVPHNIKLKMQWDKFSADSDEAIQALENELHIAAIDHINDRRYHTYAPINIEIKPDYFTEGVKLLVSFDKFDEEEREVAVNVTVPQVKIEGLTSPQENIVEDDKELFTVTFTVKGKYKEIEMAFEPGERKSIGRTKENDIAIDDISISKIHAAFVFNSLNQLMLADTGSTNGTFINGERIAYGRAFPVNDGDLLKFGTVDVSLRHLLNEKEQNVFENENLRELPETEEAVLNETSSISEIFSKKENTGSLKKDEKPKEVVFAESDDYFVSDKASDDEDELNPTNQRIILDFNENK